jgi:hypothetical protein
MSFLKFDEVRKALIGHRITESNHLLRQISFEDDRLASKGGQGSY